MSDITSTAATTTPVSLTDMKRHLNVSSTEDDALIGDYITAATLMLEQRTNRCFVSQTRQLKMQTFDDSRYVHTRTIYPPRSPLKSVTSVVYVDTNGTTTTMPSSDYVVSTGENPGRISEAYNATWPNTRNVADDVTITYVSGHSTRGASVPANIKHAMRLVVAHWYRNREGVLTGTISKEVEFGVDALLESEAMPQYG